MRRWHTRALGRVDSAVARTGAKHGGQARHLLGDGEAGDERGHGDRQRGDKQRQPDAGGAVGKLVRVREEHDGGTDATGAAEADGVHRLVRRERVSLDADRGAVERDGHRRGAHRRRVRKGGAKHAHARVKEQRRGEERAALLHGAVQLSAAGGALRLAIDAADRRVRPSPRRRSQRTSRR